MTAAGRSTRLVAHRRRPASPALGRAILRAGCAMHEVYAPGTG